VDVILYYGRLYVAHDTADITPKKTLQSLYLEPLQKAIQKHKGYAYADSSKNLLLLIDLKTPAEPTLEALLKVLRGYKTVTNSRRLKIVITGNRPDVSRWASYPSYLYFDGDVSKTYTPDVLPRVALFSNDFRTYTKWKGEGNLPDSGRVKIESAISQAHSFNKPIRFWAAPDMPDSWLQLMRLNVDFINTDKIAEFSSFIRTPASIPTQKK
jgi:alkaline phosphatase